MSYNVKTIPNFDKEVKKLAKKYKSLKNDLVKLVNIIIENPEIGTSLGSNCYKIRMSISSKGKGKSAGARVITYIKVEKETVYLLSIYDKSELQSISDKHIKSLLQDIKQ